MAWFLKLIVIVLLIASVADLITQKLLAWYWNVGIIIILLLVLIFLFRKKKVVVEGVEYAVGSKQMVAKQRLQKAVPVSRGLRKRVPELARS